jgi:hypothetical protein
MKQKQMVHVYIQKKQKEKKIKANIPSGVPTTEEKSNFLLSRTLPTNLTQSKQQ